MQLLTLYRSKTWIRYRMKNDIASFYLEAMRTKAHARDSGQNVVPEKSSTTLISGKVAFSNHVKSRNVQYGRRTVERPSLPLRNKTCHWYK